MPFRPWIVLLLFIAVSHAPGRPDSVCAEDTSAASSAERQRIDKLYFLFHPCCWQTLGEKPPVGQDPELWTACYKWERRANEDQKQLISRMKPNEALILFPIGSTTAMRELEEHAVNTLGRRAVIVRRGGPNPPRAWEQLASPFERFLNDPDLEGRADFLKDVPTEIQEELAEEIREALQVQSGAWNISVLNVMYHSRLCAMDIQNEFGKRNLHLDPATVRSEAFGEGFEQCAMTWKQMLVPYLGLHRPAENIFELSVSAAPFLVDARLHERGELSDNLRLFLWEGVDGRKIAMYARASCRLSDPQIYADLKLAGLSLEVREVHNKQCWPEADGAELELRVENGCLKVPIFNGIRRDFDWRAIVETDEEACYLIAEDISLADFRQRLVSARISR